MPSADWGSDAFATTLPAPMPALALLLLLHANPSDALNTVGVVAYQGAGRAPELATSFQTALTKEVAARRFIPTDTEKHQRGATMCGEDVECLATLGKRASVAWVLAYGLGSAGKQTFFTAILIDVETGTQQQRIEIKAETKTMDVAAIAADTARRLFMGLEPRVAIVPPVVEAPPPPPPIEEPKVVMLPLPPVERARPARTAGIVTAVGAGVLGLGAGGLGIGAGVHFESLGRLPATDRPSADSTQRILNGAADTTGGLAICAGVAAVILFIADAVDP